MLTVAFLVPQFKLMFTSRTDRHEMQGVGDTALTKEQMADVSKSVKVGFFLKREVSQMTRAVVMQLATIVMKAVVADWMNRLRKKDLTGVRDYLFKDRLLMEFPGMITEVIRKKTSLDDVLAGILEGEFGQEWTEWEDVWTEGEEGWVLSSTDRACAEGARFLETVNLPKERQIVLDEPVVAILPRVMQRRLYNYRAHKRWDKGNRIRKGDHCSQSR